jgi:acyl carrier protein
MIDRDAIRDLIKSLLRTKNDTRPFTDSDSLVLSGRLDSIEILQIVMFLEDRGIGFEDEAFDQEDFDSIERIMTRIERASTAGTQRV